MEAAYTTVSKSEDLRNFCIVLVLSKFKDHLYHIPVAAYITYELLYTVHVEAVLHSQSEDIASSSDMGPTMHGTQQALLKLRVEALLLL